MIPRYRIAVNRDDCCGWVFWYDSQVFEGYTNEVPAKMQVRALREERPEYQFKLVRLEEVDV